MRIRGSRVNRAVQAGVVLALLGLGGAAAEAQERVRPVPLGGSISKLSGERYFGVYVPTRYGGELTVSTTSGRIDRLSGPDGRARANGGEVGRDQHGWYTFRVVEADGPYEVSTRFAQVGEAARKPWNFYYWPTKGDAIHEPWAGGNGRVDTTYANGDDVMITSPGSYVAPGDDIVLPGPNGILETMPAAGDTSTWFPNLYDDLTWRGADGTVYTTPSPLLKYDQLFGTSARSWEAANAQNRDKNRWPGHCLGGAVASILLNEPVPAPGSGFTQDELKALWAELGENHLNHRIGDYATEIPPGPPRPGFDPTDRHCANVHRMLERHLRGRRQALLANMRAFPPKGSPSEVWNQGIYRYAATYYAIPGKGERSVRLVVQVEANSGSNLNESDPEPRRVTYEYTVVYGLNGEIDLTKAAQNDWIALKGDALYAPLNVLELTESRWQGHNPYVNERNIRSIDLANGGGVSGRFAGSPPRFQPVGVYEAGRGPIFAGDSPEGYGDPGNGLFGGRAAPRRGVLSRFFGGGF